MEEARANDTNHVTRAQAPMYVMVWGAISTKGKFTLKFLDDEKLTGKKYREKVLRDCMLPPSAWPLW